MGQRTYKRKSRLFLNGTPRRTGSSSLFSNKARNRSIESMAQLDRRLVQAQLRNRHPEIQMISGSTTTKAAEGLLGEIRREACTFRAFRAVQWTWAAKLVAACRLRYEANHVEHFSHRDDGAKLSVVNALHPGLRTEKRNPYSRLTTGCFRPHES